MTLEEEFVEKLDEYVAAIHATKGETGPDPEYRRAAREDEKKVRTEVIDLFKKAIS